MGLVAGERVGGVELRLSGITDQGVASANIEVDVRQRFQFASTAHLRHQLEEEPQLTDFHRFGHDVHAEEVVQDDGFVDVVTARGVAGDFIQHLREIAKSALSPGPSPACGRGEATGIFDEAFHAVEAGFVQGFQHVERGKQESARAAGGVEDGDAVAKFLVGPFRHAPDDGLPDGAQQVGAGAGVDDILHELADVEVEGDEVG